MCIVEQIITIPKPKYSVGHLLSNVSPKLEQFGEFPGIL